MYSTIQRNPKCLREYRKMERHLRNVNPVLGPSLAASSFIFSITFTSFCLLELKSGSI